MCAPARELEAANQVQNKQGRREDGKNLIGCTTDRKQDLWLCVCEDTLGRLLTVWSPGCGLVSCCWTTGDSLTTSQQPLWRRAIPGLPCCCSLLSCCTATYVRSPRRCFPGVQCFINQISSTLGFVRESVRRPFAMAESGVPPWEAARRFGEHLC